MPCFRHTFIIAFSVLTDKPDGLDVSADELWSGLNPRIASMDHEEILEAAIFKPKQSEEVEP